MAYTPTEWKDRVVEKPRTFTITNNPDGTVTLVSAPGTVVQAGTPVNAANLNNIEQGIVDSNVFGNPLLTKYLEDIQARSAVKIGTDFPHELSVPAPSRSAEGCAWSPDGTYLAVAVGGIAPYLEMYKRSGDTLTKLSGFSVSFPGATQAVDWSPDGTYLAVAHQGAPYIAVLKRNGDTFTKLANPSGVTDEGNHCSWAPNGTYLAVTFRSSPYIVVFKRNSDTFTKLANPSVVPTGMALKCSWSHDSGILAVAHSTSPCVSLYERNADVFTKLENLPNAPTSGNGRDVDWRPQGDELAVTYSVAPRMAAYRYSEGTFASIDAPDIVNGSHYVSWAPKGAFLAVTTDSSQYFGVIMYQLMDNVLTRLQDLPTTNTYNHKAAWVAPETTMYLAVPSNNEPYLYLFRFDSACIKGENSWGRFWSSLGYGVAEETGLAGQEKQVSLLWAK